MRCLGGGWVLGWAGGTTGERRRRDLTVPGRSLPGRRCSLASPTPAAITLSVVRGSDHAISRSRLVRLCLAPRSPPAPAPTGASHPGEIDGGHWAGNTAIRASMELRLRASSSNDNQSISTFSTHNPPPLSLFLVSLSFPLVLAAWFLPAPRPPPLVLSSPLAACRPSAHPVVVVFHPAPDALRALARPCDRRPDVRSVHHALHAPARSHQGPLPDRRRTQEHSDDQGQGRRQIRTRGCRRHAGRRRQGWLEGPLSWTRAQRRRKR